MAQTTTTEGGPESAAAEREDERFREFVHTRRSDLREALIADHLDLARQLARRFANRGEPYDDLFQVASLALVNAVDRFDPDRGVKFSTFAVSYVVGELKRYFRDKGWAVRAPRRVQELYLEIGKQVEALTHELGRSPTMPELAEVIGVPVEAVLEAMEAGRGYRAASLDSLQRESGPAPEVYWVEDDQLGRVVTRSVLVTALRNLSPREQELVRLRFVEGLTQSEIAKRIGVSQMQVSRLLAQSLSRLRNSLDEDVS